MQIRRQDAAAFSADFVNRKRPVFGPAMGNAEVREALIHCSSNTVSRSLYAQIMGLSLLLKPSKAGSTRVGIKPIRIYSGSPLSAALRLPAGQ